MSESPRNYSALSTEEQAAVSVWIDSFDQSYEYEGGAALKKAVKSAPPELRSILLSQLLPALIDHDRKRQGRTPTLHELRSRFPDLAADLTEAYPLMPDGYRLPVELRGYRVLSVVGEGGQALVLRAQDDMHSAVAIKLSASPEHNEMLLRERELLGQCQHPGIPEVIASGVVEERAFFVMPFLRGMTLADKYATHRPTAQEATRIAAELCAVVDHLHTRSILHRDIKPQNVWLDESGGVKLIDLGLAVDRSSWGSPRAAVDEFHGTPAFMSPEQAAADRENDGELSDVFSIGAVLYWMGTGVAPYGEGSSESVLARASEGRFEQDRLQLSSSWPKSLIQLCLHAMSAVPTNRIASAEKFGKELRASSVRSADKSWPQRPKAIAMAAALLLLATVVVLARPNLPILWSDATQPQTDASPTSSSTAADEPPRERWIDRVATENEVKLASIGPDDFEPGVKCRARLIEPWGKQKRSASVVHEFTLRLNKKVSSLAAVAEYRVGDSVWGQLSATSEDRTYTAPLSILAAGNRGPVEVRLVSDPGQRSVTAVGPFRYEIDIGQALQDDEQLFGRELLEEATTEKCFDVELPGWVVREAYSRRFGPIVEEFYFGEQRDGPMTSVSDQLDKLAGREKGTGRPGLDLRQGFAIVSKEIQDKNKLWIKIRFSGTGTWGPVLYAKPLTEQQERKQRVDSWFDQVESDETMARYNSSKFVMTRLNEILPELSHLHIIGKYAVFGSKDGLRLAESAELIVDLKRLPEDRVIDLSPVWTQATVKGRLIGGGFTPSIKISHSDSACGCAVAPNAASPGLPELENYLYIDRDAYPDSSMSILPLLVNARALQRDTVETCKRTRLVLSPMRPAHAVSVKHYTDRDFKTPMKAVKPGLVYARYFDVEGKSIGHSTYQLTPELLHEWTEHALWHVAGPVDLEKMQKEQKAMQRQKELRQRVR